MHSRPKEYFVVSTFNEERSSSQIGVYRKHNLQFTLGPYEDGAMILDLKAQGNKIYIPKGSSMIERQEVKGL